MNRIILNIVDKKTEFSRRIVIEQGIRHIATDGEEVGQINGLSVVSLGSSSFGIPSRITALTRPARRGN